MIKGKILWIDDEIELLKAHILYLEKKDYSVTSVSSGEDGIKILSQLAMSSGPKTQEYIINICSNIIISVRTRTIINYYWILACSFMETNFPHRNIYIFMYIIIYRPLCVYKI